MSGKLDSKAVMGHWIGPSPRLLKIAGLMEFASGQFPLEDLLLDLRLPAIRNIAHSLLTLPWGGMIVDEPSEAPDKHPWLATSGLDVDLAPGDVVELQPAVGKVARRFRRGSNGNILFATERCNSFCMMCSQPPREIDDTWRTDGLKALIELIDRDAPLLTLTGGEPTLLGIRLAEVIGHAGFVLPDTAIHVLSNGRNFDNADLARTFTDLHPRLSWGIPLYGDHAALHDYIVQRQGAFTQTLRGLYALKEAQQRLEIRVVLIKPVVERLTEIARFLYRAFPFADHIALMGTEPAGFAKAHSAELWVDPIDYATILGDATRFLARRGMNVSLYNLPLCALPADIRQFAARSISDWKQAYQPACKDCNVRNQCGGFFVWNAPGWTSRAIRPILKER